MISTRNLVTSVCWLLLWTSLICAQDLSKYRDFQLGMNLHAVVEIVDARPSEVKVLHQRPALIQELAWRPQRAFGSSREGESVNEVLLNFYNGELFRMVVSYDQQRTEGLTDQDMIEAISATYGIATQPAAKIVLFSSSYIYNDSEKVIARWEDSQSSVNLFRSSSLPRFGMLIFSKRVDALAQAAIVNAIRIDEREAPQREIAREKKEGEESRAAKEKARPANKADFRP
jgi:hypothetical protein